MEPAVRSARAQSGIAATLLLGRRLRQPKKVGITAAYLSGFAPTPGRSPSRERNFSMQRRRAQIRLFVLQRLTRRQGRARKSPLFTGQMRVSPAEFDT